MARRERSFSDRPPFEQRFMLENTWCDACEKADLGLRDPLEYEEDGSVIIEGRCRECGAIIQSVVEEREAKL
jgi:hypothetical protein